MSEISQASLPHQPQPSPVWRGERQPLLVVLALIGAGDCLGGRGRNEENPGAACDNLGFCANCHPLCYDLLWVAPHTRCAGSRRRAVLWHLDHRCVEMGTT